MPSYSLPPTFCLHWLFKLRKTILTQKTIPTPVPLVHVVDIVGKFANITGGAPFAANISANFRKNLNKPFWCSGGLGETHFMKKSEVKNFVALSL
jgi:hypothetical protein